MTGRHYHCDLLTREYHLFVNLRSGSIDIILSQNYSEASFLRFSLSELVTK